MDKLKSRKRLRLIGYDYSKDGAYFITICTKDRRCILSNIVGTDDYIGPKVQLTEIGKLVQKYILQLMVLIVLL